MGQVEHVLSIDDAYFEYEASMTSVTYTLSGPGIIKFLSFKTGTSSVGSVRFPDALDSVIESLSGKCVVFLLFHLYIFLFIIWGPDFRILFSRGLKNTASV
jgi:hypothetical protein